MQENPENQRFFTGFITLGSKSALEKYLPRSFQNLNYLRYPRVGTGGTPVFGFLEVRLITEYPAKRNPKNRDNNIINISGTGFTGFHVFFRSKSALKHYLTRSFLKSN